MKAIVTGGAGFIGSHLVSRLLSLQYSVLVIDNFSSRKKDSLKRHLKNRRLRIVKADLLYQKALNKYFTSDVDIVFHLAANPNIAKGVKDPSIDFKQTIVATFHVLQAMRRAGIRKIFYTSGSGVYGDHGSLYMKESCGELSPVSMYGASKLSAEAFISAFCHLFDMQAWILRPANIVGSHITHGVAFDFFNKLRKDPTKLEILGDGKQSKSYLSVEDVIDAILLVLKKSRNRLNIFNIASEDSITVTDIAYIVISKLKLKNVHLQYTGGKVGWKGDVPKVRLSSDKILKLGWKPRFNSREAIVQTVQALMAEH